MDAELKAKWVAALRSGEYKQARRTLRIKEPDGTYAYCCLGVLMEVSGRGAWMNYAELNNLVGGEMEKPMHRLIELNDTEKWPFPRIAEFIEANL